MRRFAALIVVALAATSPALADTAEQANRTPGRPLALSETLQVAVRQNPDLERATIDIAVAQASVLQSLGLDDWVVTGTGSWSSTRNKRDPDVDFQPLRDDAYSLAADLSRGLTTGGTISFRANGRLNDSENFSRFEDAMNNTIELIQTSRNYSAGISATYWQPLLRDRGKRIARASQRQAIIARDSTTLAREGVALATVRDVVNAYWELAYTAREIEIRKGSLALAEEQLRITRAGIDAGAVAPTESLALEQGIAVREEAILLAEIAVSQRSLELRRLVGLEIGPGEIDIIASEPPAIEERDYDLDATLARALERNPSLALLAKTDEANQIEIELTENGLRPRLDLTASAGPTGQAGSLGDTVKEMGRFDAYTLSASLRYEHTLGNRAAKGARERSRQQALRTRVDLETGKRETAVAVVNAVNLVRSARKRIEVTRKSIDLAEKNLQTEKARFEAGDATNFDILRRQEEIEQAQLGHERAIVDYLQAIALVDSLTGDLLDRYGIAIAEGSDS